MFDLIVEDHHTDRDILLHILKGLKIMALDLTKLTAATTDNASAVSALSGSVDQLIALHTDPAAQAAVDAAAVAIASNTDVIKATEVKVAAAIAPPAPVAEQPAA